MKQRKDYITINWNREVKTYLVIFLLLIFSIGMLAGGFVGASKACSDTDVSEETTVQTETPLETIVYYVPPTKTYYDCPLSEDLQDYISKQCEEKGVPIPLILAMIETESSFKADAVSGTNDYGLMQINIINHERFRNEYGIVDFLDPYQNVFCGITMISEHYNRYGDIDKALMAYNLGASGAKRLWDIGIYHTAYTEEIRANMEAYEEDLK